MEKIIIILICFILLIEMSVIGQTKYRYCGITQLKAYQIIKYHFLFSKVVECKFMQNVNGKYEFMPIGKTKYMPNIILFLGNVINI